MYVRVQRNWSWLILSHWANGRRIALSRMHRIKSLAAQYQGTPIGRLAESIQPRLEAEVTRHQERVNYLLAFMRVLNAAASFLNVP